MAKKKKKHNSLFIKGILIFETKKTLIRSENEDFFVRWKIPTNLIHGDLVLAKITKKSEEWKLSEVHIIKYIKESNHLLLGKKINNFLIPSPHTSTFSKIPLDKYSQNFPNNILVEFRIENRTARIIKIFETDIKNEQIASIFFLNQISDQWNQDIQKEIIQFQQYKELFKPIDQHIPEHFLLSKTHELDSSTKNHPEQPWAILSENEKKFSRISLENWFTFTIDWSDAKDLDDAISIAQYTNGDFLLGVHIADVSYFVQEKTATDREAYARGTSIYLPDRVIPMLPEILSNSLCSLNTDWKKLSISCIMKIQKNTGKVLHTDIFPSIIKSEYRGVYDEVYKNFQEKTYPNNTLWKSIELSFNLFEILQKRRKNEWKIHFETTELYFNIENEQTVWVKKRERNKAHLLIEEFMVLANEEVAKWCEKRKIPFLSRVHHPPSEETTNTIHAIVWHPKNRKNTPITPLEIENFLSSKNDSEKYFYSRLLLPKMSKALYSYNHHWHFGLALDHYSHFTSPIRRYPDLITHRMIHKYLSKNLNKTSKEKSEKILPKIALSTSNSEKRAENIERAVEKIYILNYISHHIWEKFFGKISGITEWWVFIELENGIEVTVYLPRKHQLQLDENSWSLINNKQEKILQIGEIKEVTILKILEEEWRILAHWAHENENI